MYSDSTLDNFEQIGARFSARCKKARGLSRQPRLLQSEFATLVGFPHPWHSQKEGGPWAGWSQKFSKYPVGFIENLESLISERLHNCFVVTSVNFFFKIEE